MLHCLDSLRGFRVKWLQWANVLSVALPNLQRIAWHAQLCPFHVLAAHYVPAVLPCYAIALPAS
eukprot:1015938-Alexandrium_andersonii.AAC.1